MAEQGVYLGNPNLKKANVAQNFTKKQVAEYLKCAGDPVYFIREYIKTSNNLFFRQILSLIHI